MKEKQPKGDNFFEQVLNEFANSLQKLLERGIKQFASWLNIQVTEFLSFLNNERKALKVKKTAPKKIKDLKGYLGYSLSSRRDVMFEEMDWGAHTLVSGSSGTGKTCFIMLSAEGMMMKGNSVVFIDPKADILSIKAFRAMARVHNVKLHVFQEGYEGEDKVKLNPFKGRNLTDCKLMFESAFSYGADNPFYLNVQLAAVNEIMQEIKMKGEEISLPKIQRRYIELYKSDDKHIGMINKLNNLIPPELAERMDGDDALGLEEIIESKASIYIGINVQSLGKYGKVLGKLITSEITKISGKRQSFADNKEYAPRATIIFDEAGSVIVEEFLELLNKARSAKLELVILCQSFNDLAQAWEKKWSGERSIWTSISNFITFRQEDDEILQCLSKVAGTVTTIKRTQQVNDGLTTGGESLREVEEFVVHPNLIRNLKVGQAVVINKRKTLPTLIELVAFRDIESSSLYDIKNEVLKIRGLVDYKKLSEERKKTTENNFERSKSDEMILDKELFKTKLDYLLEDMGIDKLEIVESSEITSGENGESETMPLERILEESNDLNQQYKKKFSSLNISVERNE